ncbi:MAG TPA: hypothetical protein VJN92_10445 [Candidatus Acidoferrum sp.]|nr:hypothetical protein [Candidatus Acidoferrum sp.]
MAAEGKQHFQEIKIWFQSAEYFWIGHQLSESITVQSMFFDDRNRFLGEQLSDFAQPSRHGKLAWIETCTARPSLIRFSTHAAASVLPRVEEIECIFDPLLIERQTNVEAVFGILAQN